jgi:hypothetical protein
MEPTDTEISDAVALEAPVKSGLGPDVEVVDELHPESAIANEQLSMVHNAGAL